MATGNLLLSNSLFREGFYRDLAEHKIVGARMQYDMGQTRRARIPKYSTSSYVYQNCYWFTNYHETAKISPVQFKKKKKNFFKTGKSKKLKIVGDIWKKIGLFPCFSLKQNKVFGIFCKLPRRMLKCEIFPQRIKRY